MPAVGHKERWRSKRRKPGLSKAGLSYFVRCVLCHDATMLLPVFPRFLS